MSDTKKKAICGGFFVDEETGLKFDGDTLEVVTPIPEITDEDEGKVLKVINGELVFADA